MRTLPFLVLVLVLTLAPGLAHGQGAGNLGRYHGPEVRTVETDGSIAAGRAIGGLSVDAQGRIYSATFRAQVYRIERDGTVNVLTDSFVQASGNTIDHGGELIQSEYWLDRLYRVHEDGSRTLITDTGLSGPVGVVMDSSGDCFVANFGNDTISRVTPDGTTSLFSSDFLLNGPNGIVIDAAGDLYVANFRDNLLLRLDASGTATIVAAVGQLAQRNNAHVAACNGKLYVSKIFAHGIYEVTPAGQVELIVGNGTPGTQDGFAPHQAKLYHPNGMATAPGGKVLYTNNYIGIMGRPSSTMTVRAIHLW